MEQKTTTKKEGKHSAIDKFVVDASNRYKIVGSNGFKWSEAQHIILIARIVESYGYPDLDNGETVYMGKLFALLHNMYFNSAGINIGKYYKANKDEKMILDSLLNHKDIKLIYRAYKRAVQLADMLVYNKHKSNKIGENTYIKYLGYKIEYIADKMASNITTNNKEYIQGVYLYELFTTLNTLGIDSKMAEWNRVYWGDEIKRVIISNELIPIKYDNIYKYFIKNIPNRGVYEIYSIVEGRMQMINEIDSGIFEGVERLSDIITQGEISVDVSERSK